MGKGAGRQIFLRPAILFAEVDDALGEKLTAIMWGGPSRPADIDRERLKPALMAVSLAAMRVARGRGRGSIFKARRGHSLPGTRSANIPAARCRWFADNCRHPRGCCASAGKAMQAAVARSAVGAMAGAARASNSRAAVRRGSRRLEAAPRRGSRKAANDKRRRPGSWCPATEARIERAHRDRQGPGGRQARDVAPRLPRRSIARLIAAGPPMRWPRALSTRHG